MKKAVIVSKNTGNIETLAEMLTAEGFSSVKAACCRDEACELINLDKPDFILINTPIADGTGIELAVECSSACSAGVVLIVRQEKADEVQHRVLKYGIPVLAKPLGRGLFHHYLLFEECFRRRTEQVRGQNDRLRTQVETLKLINRAKLLLMQHLRMSEEQAHHYLERQAMDLRKSKYDVALSVLKTYENR